MIGEFLFLVGGFYFKLVDEVVRLDILSGFFGVDGLFEIIIVCILFLDIFI